MRVKYLWSYSLGLQSAAAKVLRVRLSQKGAQASQVAASAVPPSLPASFANPTADSVRSVCLQRVGDWQTFSARSAP